MVSTRCFPSRRASRTPAVCRKSGYGKNVCMVVGYPKMAADSAVRPTFVASMRPERRVKHRKPLTREDGDTFDMVRQGERIEDAQVLDLIPVAAVKPDVTGE